MKRTLLMIVLLTSPLPAVANDAPALQALIDRAFVNGTTFKLSGNFSISTPIVLKGNTDASDATIEVTDGSIQAVILSNVSGVRVVLPNIINLQKPGNGIWVASGTGFKMVNVSSSHIEIRRIKNFDVGVALLAVGTGSVHNNIFVGHLENNRVNLLLDPWSGGSWVNQNTFYGGRYSHYSNEGIALPHVHQIVLKNSDGTYGAPNGNTWIGASFEGRVPKHAVDIDGHYNVFYNCRWEGVNGVFFRSETWGNVIQYGYGSSALPVFGDTTDNKVIAPF